LGIYLRIAIISDIHGNLTALKTVISIVKNKADRIVCLGDVAATGPQPHETIAFLKETKCLYVMGNTDESLAKSVREDFKFQGDLPEEEMRKLKRLDEWTRTQLTSLDRDFLSTFKTTIAIKNQKSSLLCYHGSPRSNKEGIFIMTPDDQVSKILENYSATIFAGGHIHTQMFRRFLGSIIINPGSVGLSFEKDSTGKIRNCTWAEYAIVTFGGQKLNAELHRIRYDFAKLIKAVQRSGMPNPDWWLSDWK
jgi:putative phosphoesterase